jgi:hypothetical protein
MSTYEDAEGHLSKADRRRLDPDFVRRVIAELCNLWEQTLGTAIAYREEIDEDRAIGITTQAHHAARMARAVLLIDGVSSGIEIVPSVRLILECGVTAAWLLLTPGSGNTLLRDGAGERRKAIEHLMRVDEEAGDDTDESVSPAYEQVLGAIETLENSDGPRSFILEQRCNALKGGSGIYVLYRVLSAQSHSGMGIMDFYIREDPDSPIHISFDPDRPNDSRVSYLGITASMLLLALNADEQARRRPRHSTQIRKAAKKLGISHRIVGKDGTELPERL